MNRSRTVLRVAATSGPATAALAEFALETRTGGGEALAASEYGRYAAILVDASLPDLPRFLDAWRCEGDGRVPLLAVASVDELATVSADVASRVDDVLAAVSPPAALAHQVGRAIEYRRMRRQLFDVEKLALLGSVSAGVLHELKNPLNNLLGGMERLLARVNTDPAVLRWGGLMRRNGELLRDCLGDLLDGLRGGPTTDLADLHEILDRALTYCLKGDTSFREIEVVRDWDEITPLVMGSAGQLLHLFLNLILNARQAIGSGPGRIVVRTRWSDGQAVVDVEDSGPGVPADVLANLFNSFHTTKPGGSGMGLVFCRQIADRHGGQMEVNNLPRGGAQFRVTLPAGRSADAAPRLV